MNVMLRKLFKLSVGVQEVITRPLPILQFVKNSHNFEVSMENKFVENSIKEKLKCALKPVFLKIINESYQHNVPKESETHFKIVVVSQEFENMTLLERHRLVNSILETELRNKIHALSIDAKAPSQWNPNEEIKSSPKCLGGFGK